jgi:hypothetical protein
MRRGRGAQARRDDGYNLWMNLEEAIWPGCAALWSRAGPLPVSGAGVDPTGKANNDADLPICKRE